MSGVPLVGEAAYLGRLKARTIGPNLGFTPARQRTTALGL